MKEALLMDINYRGTVIPNSSVSNEKIRMVDQIWKLIPMREHNEDWQTQLYTLLEEIAGLGHVAQIAEDTNFLILLAKLEGLDSEYCEDFMIYRKTIFKCINLLTKILNDE